MVGVGKLTGAVQCAAGPRSEQNRWVWKLPVDGQEHVKIWHGKIGRAHFRVFFVCAAKFPVSAVVWVFVGHFTTKFLNFRGHFRGHLRVHSRVHFPDHFRKRIRGSNFAVRVLCAFLSGIPGVGASLTEIQGWAPAIKWGDKKGFHHLTPNQRSTTQETKQFSPNIRHKKQSSCLQVFVFNELAGSQFPWKCKSCFSNRALVKVIFEGPKCR